MPYKVGKRHRRPRLESSYNKGRRSNSQVRRPKKKNKYRLCAGRVGPGFRSVWGDQLAFGTRAVARGRTLGRATRRAGRVDLRHLVRELCRFEPASVFHSTGDIEFASRDRHRGIAHESSGQRRVGKVDALQASVRQRAGVLAIVAELDTIEIGVDQAGSAELDSLHCAIADTRKVDSRKIRIRKVAPGKYGARDARFQIVKVNVGRVDSGEIGVIEHCIFHEGLRKAARILAFSSLQRSFVEGRRSQVTIRERAAA